MADWLKPFARTPKIGTAAGEHATSFSTDDEDYAIPKLRPSSRVSSYICFRAPTPPVLNTSDPVPNIRHPHDVYHKPSGDQMAETLKVVMMNQSTMSPVPIEYNSCILHLLEAYYQLGQRANKAGEAFEELRLQRENDIKALEELQKEWDSKEMDYKADVKRLEVLLSHTQGGMDQVMLARTKSSVHGTRRIKETIERRVSTMKERSADLDRQEREDSNGFSDFKEIKVHPDSGPLRRMFHHRGVVQTPTPKILPPLAEKVLGKILRDLHSRMSTSSLQGLASSQEHAELTKPNLEAMERARLEDEHDMSFTSTQSTQSTNSAQMGGGAGLGLGILQKPLPAVPGVGGGRRTSSDSSDQEESPFRYPLKDPGAFSFRPGDDTALFARDAARVRNIKKQVNEEIRQRRVASADDDPAIKKEERVDAATKTPAPSFSAKKKSSISRPHLTRDSQGSGTLWRDGSSSSVITAVRHNSHRSSASDMQTISERDGKKRPQRSTGSSEAVTAATRALGDGPRNAPSQHRKSSDSQEHPRHLEVPRIQTPVKTPPKRQTSKSAPQADMEGAKKGPIVAKAPKKGKSEPTKWEYGLGSRVS